MSIANYIVQIQVKRILSKNKIFCKDFIPNTHPALLTIPATFFPALAYEPKKRTSLSGYRTINYIPPNMV